MSIVHFQMNMSIIHFQMDISNIHFQLDIHYYFPTGYVHYAEQVLPIWLAVNTLPPYHQQHCLRKLWPRKTFICQINGDINPRYQNIPIHQQIYFNYLAKIIKCVRRWDFGSKKFGSKLLLWTNFLAELDHSMKNLVGKYVDFLEKKFF